MHTEMHQITPFVQKTTKVTVEVFFKGKSLEGYTLKLFPLLSKGETFAFVLFVSVTF